MRFIPILVSLFVSYNYIDLNSIKYDSLWNTKVLYHRRYHTADRHDKRESTYFRNANNLSNLGNGRPISHAKSD